MGQKTHPVGFRLSVTRKWLSVWFSDKDYRKNLLQDAGIRKFVRERAQAAGIHRAIIERSLSKIKVTLIVARPGVIIGRGGSNLQILRDDLRRLTGSPVDLVIEDFKTPELSAQLVAEDVVRQIKQRLPVRRIMSATTERVYGRGVKGVKIICSGVLSGPSSISRSEKKVLGSIPAQTLRANIDFARATVFTTYGTIGVKVWIYLGEVEKS